MILTLAVPPGDWRPDPFPGSAAARAGGCTCPVDQPWPGRLNIDTECPIHEPEKVPDADIMCLDPGLDPEMAAQIRELVGKVAPRPQWEAFAGPYMVFLDACESSGIPAHRFFLMLALCLGAGIAGQPEGTARDEALRCAWDCFVHGAASTGFDTWAWLERAKANGADTPDGETAP